MSMYYCDNCERYHDADYIDTVEVDGGLYCEESTVTDDENPMDAVIRSAKAFNELPLDTRESFLSSHINPKP